MAMETYGPVRRVLTKCLNGQCPPGPEVAVSTLCPGYITGVVYDARTHYSSPDISHPLPGMEVWAESNETGSFAEAVTDGKGRYQLGPLEPGEDYRIVAKGPCYSYRVLDNRNVPEIGLIQDVAVTRYGCVHGVIRNAAGDPISGAKISFFQTDEPVWGAGQARSNANGEFLICTLEAISISNLNSCNHSVLVTHPEHSYVEGVIAVVPYYIQGDVLDVEYIMQPRATIAGSVSSDALPLSGASILLHHNTEGLMLTEQEEYFTDASGNFSINVNAPATYRIVIQGDETELAHVEVSVVPNQTTPIVLDLAGPGFISGIVNNLLGQPVEGATIEVLTLTGKGPIQTSEVVTDINGNYQTPGLQPFDEYIINAIMPGVEFFTQFVSQGEIIVVSGNTTVVNLQGDTIVPTCEITSPDSGDVISGITSIEVTGSDNQGVLCVDLVVDGELFDTVEVSDPESSIIQQITTSFQLDTTTMPNGMHLISINTFDLVGLQGSNAVSITVSN